MKTTIKIIAFLGLMGLLFTSVSCSKSHKKVNTSFSIFSGFSTGGTSVLTGGLVVYGRSDTGGSLAMYLPDENAQAAPVSLINGVWNFQVLGWVTTPLTGSARCGQATATLEGGDANINIIVDAAGCSSPEIRGAIPLKDSALAKFADISFSSCEQFIDSSATPISQTNNTYNCANNYAGYARSYSATILRPDGSEMISSACLANKSHSVDTTFTKIDTVNDYGPVEGYKTELNIPLDHGPNFPIKIRINAYHKDDCMGTFQPYIFDQGMVINKPDTLFINKGMAECIISGPTNSTDCTSAGGMWMTDYCYDSMYSNETDCNSAGGGRAWTIQTPDYRLFLQSDSVKYCELNSGNAPFASTGASTGLHNSDPHLLCTEAHLRSVANHVVSVSNQHHFKLLNDINFYQNYDPATDTGEPAPFEMIGSPIDTNPNTTTFFLGSFNGNNHAIKGLMIEIEATPGVEYSNIGFIRHLGYDTGTSGVVRDLNFILPEIYFEYDTRKVVNQVGIVAGKSEGEIYNVSVQHARVEGNRDIGGIVGLQDGTTGGGPKVHNSTTEFSYVQGFKNAGGLVGRLLPHSGTYNILQSSTNGRVEVHSHGASNFCHWEIYTDEASCTGATGSWRTYDLLCEDTTYTEMAGCDAAADHSWYQANSAGGLIGKIEGAASWPTISESSSSAYVGGDYSVGGLVGTIDSAFSGNAIENSYATGNIKSYDPMSPTGGIVGQNQSNLNRVFFSTGAIDFTNGNTAVGGVQGNGSGTCSSANGCLSTYSVNMTGAATKTYADIRTMTTFTGSAFDISSASTGTSLWEMRNDTYDIPKLRWEKSRLCADKIALAPFAGGTGTEADPFLICSKAQFQQIASHNGMYFKLLAPIDLIGTSGSSAFLTFGSGFNGQLDGNHHFISNLSLMTNSELGLFNRLSPGGKVHHLNLTGVNISGTDFLGSVAGKSEGGEISYVEASGKITGVTVSTSVGGLVGQITSGGVVSYSQANLAITGGQSKTGGLVGSIMSKGTIQYSKSHGMVTVLDAITSQDVGGIVGGIAGADLDNKAVVRETLFDGHISIGAASTPNNIGGVVGLTGMYSEVVDCQSRGRIQDYHSTDPTYYVGGLVGKNNGVITTSFVSPQFEKSFPSYNTMWGPLVGDNTSGTINNAFYLSHMYTGLNTIGTGEITEGTPAADPANYPTFNITSDWDADGGVWYLGPESTYGPELMAPDEMHEGDESFYFELLGLN